jgi:hypothetical protein
MWQPCKLKTGGVVGPHMVHARKKGNDHHHMIVIKAGDLNLPLEYEKLNFVNKSLIGIINQYFILEFYFQISGFNEFKRNQ